jgi:hypothetical protein
VGSIADARSRASPASVAVATSAPAGCRLRTSPPPRVGDQYSDLKGGYSDRTFKKPNPNDYLP